MAGVTQPGGGGGITPVKLYVAGHSYGAGSMTSPTVNRTTAKLATMWGATETNIAVSSSTLVSHSGAAGPDATSGGWATIMQSHAPTHVTSQADSPYLSPLQVAVLYHGLNDAALLGMTQFSAAFPHVLRAVIDRFRAGRLDEDSAATVVFGGTWTVGTATANNSGAGYRFTSTNGSTATVSVPADYNGQALTFGMIPTPSTAGLVTVTEGATTLATFQHSGIAPTAPARNVGARIRLAAGTLTAGAHTLVLTYTGITGGNVFFDYWQIESTPPPLVLIPLVNTLADYAAHAVGWAGAPLDDTKVATINSAITTVCAEYTDGLVKAVPTDDLLNKSLRLFLSDKVHPNAQGAALIASRLAAYAEGALTKDNLAQIGTA